MAEYIKKIGYDYIFINEIMPVHRLSIIKSIYNADYERFRVFPKRNMVTHHIETLIGGREKKKILADIVYNKPYFTNQNQFIITLLHNLYTLLLIIMKIIPKSNWVKRKKSTFQL